MVMSRSFVRDYTAMRPRAAHRAATVRVSVRGYTCPIRRRQSLTNPLGIAAVRAQTAGIVVAFDHGQTLRPRTIDPPASRPRSLKSRTCET